MSNTELLVLRDVSSLFRKYEPLRRAIFREYQHALDGHHSKEELKSFINEHFVRLCYEYDISGEVGFAGYIKTMLTIRVQYSFLGKERKYTNKVVVGTDSDIQDSLLEISNGEDDYQLLVLEFLEYIVTSCNVKEIDVRVIGLIVTETPFEDIVSTLTTEFTEINGRKITRYGCRKKCQEMRELLAISVQEWLHT